MLQKQHLPSIWMKQGWTAGRFIFVNPIVEFIVHNGLMKDLSVLQEAPFTDRGSIVRNFLRIHHLYGREYEV